MLNLLVGTLTEGLIYALLAYGIFITYKILDFPDLSVDGSFPLGAAVTAVVINADVNPFLALLISLCAGALAGLCTGIIHVRFKVRDLLAGIITMTALFSINLQIAGSNMSIIGKDTIFRLMPFGDMPQIYRKLIVAVIIAIVVKLILDLYFKTQNGLLLRSVGDNENLVCTLGIDNGNMKILGLVIANALVALCGSVVCQQQQSFNSTMGTGQMVFGLAAVIIGTTIFKKVSFVKGTTAVMVGSIIYKACIQSAITLGLPANLMRLITAVLFLVILVLGNLPSKKGGKKNA